MDKNFPSQTLLILGRNPVISIAEIRARFPDSRICAREKDFAIFERINEIDLKTIGGVVKTGEVFGREMGTVEIPKTKNQIPNKNQKPKTKGGNVNLAKNFEEKIGRFLADEFAGKEGKCTFGISVYPQDDKLLKTLLIGAKKFLKVKGISSRFANKNFKNLTNPQSEFELVKKGGVEIIVVQGSGNWFFAKLKQNQPFDSYRKRDYEKAYRDARVGMLPPKLAQIMVNLGCRGQGAGDSNIKIPKPKTQIPIRPSLPPTPRLRGTSRYGGQDKSQISNSNVNKNDDFIIGDEVDVSEKEEMQDKKLEASNYKLTTVYDPFCGAGGILVEAALMGYKVIGSDIDERMVEFSQKNLEAMKLEGEVFTQDAKYRPDESKWRPFDVVVSEGYLGPPRKTIPSEVARKKIFAELQELYEKFFAWVNCRRVVICFPIYLEHGQPKYFASAEILPMLRKLGWQMKNTEKLTYARKSQTVGREVVVLESGR